MTKLDLQPLDLEPVDEIEQPKRKLDLQPLDLEPIDSAPDTDTTAPAAAKLDLEPVDQDYKQVQDVKNRSFWSAPLVGTEPTTDKELEAIARKHGVDPDALKDIATNVGAHREAGKADTLGELESSLGRGVGAGIPQFIGKKSLDDPKLREAIDDVRELANQKRSFAQGLAENVIPVGAVGRALGLGQKAATGVIKQGLLKATGKAAAEGAAIGATYGLTGSEEGREGQGTVSGAVLGGGLGAATTVAGRLVSKMIGSKSEKAVAAAALEKEGPELDRGTQKLLEERAHSESILEQAIEKPVELSPADAKALVKEQLDPEFVARLLDPSTEEGALYREKVTQSHPETVQQRGYAAAIEESLAKDVAERRARDFAEDLTGTKPKTLEEARRAIADVADRQGSAATKEKYRLYAEEQAAKDYIDRNAIRGGRGDHFGNKALNFISDSQFVLRDIDQKLGTSAEATHRQLNSDYNRMSFARDAMRKQVDEIYQAAKPIDAEVTKGTALYHALDSGRIDALPTEQQAVAQKFKEYFTHAREYANQLVKEGDPSISPLAIPKQDNYVPHMLKPTPELVSQVAARMEEVSAVANQAYGKELARLTPKETVELLSQGAGKDLSDALKIFDIKPVRTGAELEARIHDTFNSRSGRIALETKARAALERTGDIPMWMRETNLYKLADRWGSNTLRHLFLRKSMDRLGSISRRLDSAGATLESEYVKRLLQDINGVRKGTAAEFTRQTVVKWQSALDRAADRANNPATKAVTSVAKAIPELIGDLGRQIYPNLLGLNPKAMIQNAMQPFLKTAPELGNKYGYAAVFRGTVHALRDLSGQMEKVNQLGLAPAEFNSQFSRAMADGVRRTALYAMPSELAQKMGNASLYLYSKLDGLNRAISLSTAEILANDLARGSKLAQQAFDKMPSALRRQVQLEPNRAAELIAQHLNASTQYNYNRASMSEFGRTMGPLFSIFSKWPTATAGEIIQGFREKGALRGSLRNAEKYLYPLLMLKVADFALTGGEDPKDGLSDRQKKLFGGTGIAAASPLGSIEGIAKGQFFTPPAIEALLQGVVNPAMEGNEGKFQKSLANSIQQWTPGAVYIRFITDDMITYLSGRRPEGSNFLERTQEGIHQLRK